MKTLQQLQFVRLDEETVHVQLVTTIFDAQTASLVESRVARIDKELICRLTHDDLGWQDMEGALKNLARALHLSTAELDAENEEN